MMDVTCRRCGLRSPSDHRFCGYCGASLRPTHVGRNATGVTGSATERVPAPEEMRVASILKLSRVRHVIGVIQGTMLLAACLLLVFPLVSFWWAVGVFGVLCLVQVLVSLAIRRAGGRGAMDAVMEIERQGPFH